MCVLRMVSLFDGTPRAKSFDHAAKYRSSCTMLVSGLLLIIDRLSRTASHSELL